MEAEISGEEEDGTDYEKNQRDSRPQHSAGPRRGAVPESTVPKRVV